MNITAQPGLTFDPGWHRYFWNGVQVPGISEILKGVGLIDDRFYNDEAALQGTYIHKATALWDRGTLDEDTLDPAIKPYLEGWKAYRAQSGIRPVEIEQPRYSEIFGFAGTPDRISDAANGHRVIEEIKTGYEATWWDYQRVGQDILVNGTRFNDCDLVVVRLFGNGRISAHVMEARERSKLRGEFLALLTTFNIKRNLGLIKLQQEAA